MSVNSTNPGTLFGGTWEQIQNRFLLAAGSSYTAGATGGSANAVVVKHKHTFTGTAVTSGNNSVNHNHSHNGAFLKWANNVVGTVALSGRTTVASGWKGSDQSGMVNTTGNQSANHTHSVTAKGTISEEGSSATNANMPPYLVVYVWKRIA